MWFKTDDRWKRHPKVRSLGRSGDLIGVQARALWFFAGSICNDQTPNLGVVTPSILDEAVFLSGVADADEAVGRLVDSGLWHDAKSFRRCKKLHDVYGPITCREAVGRNLKADEYHFHHWFDVQLASDRQENPIGRLRERRRKALHRNPSLKSAIRARDRDLCRYCGELTTWTADRKSLNVGQFDHVDPFYDLDGPTMGNTMDNVVVACLLCNSDKKDRTPEQWHAEGGRLLRPPPDPDRSRPDQDHIKTASSPIKTGSGPSRARRDRSGSGPDPGLDSARIGSDPAPARLPVSVSPRFKGNNGNGNGAKL